MGEASFECLTVEEFCLWECVAPSNINPALEKEKKKQARDPNKDASHWINSAWLYSLRHKNTAGGHNQIASDERGTQKGVWLWVKSRQQASGKLHWHKLERNTRGLNTQHGQSNKEQVKVTWVGQSQQRRNEWKCREKKQCKVRQHMWLQKA